MAASTVEYQKHMSELQEMPRTEGSVPLHQVICLLSACGVSSRIIADEFKMQASSIASFLTEERARFEVKRLQAKFFAADPKKRFRAMSDRAMEVLEDLQEDSAKEGTRLRAAGEVLDRAFGKPEQTVNLEGSLIRRLYEKLDAAGPELTPVPDHGIDITTLSAGVVPEESVPGPKKTDIDGWADQNL